MNSKKHLIAITLLAACAGSQANTLNQTFDVPAKSFKVLDLTTGTIIAEKNKDERTKIASLTKVMTAYIVFSEIQNGTLSFSDEVLVSKNAWQTGGSKMFIEVGKKVNVEDLIKGIIIISGNDASVAISEHIAGTEERFVELMNKYAKAIGMENTKFANSTGLPTKAEQYSTAHDLALLASRLFKDFPQHMHFFKEKEYEYNDIKQPNRNRLLNTSDSYNGLKTGYTANSGYSLISTFHEDNRKIVTVTLNSKTVNDRFEAARELTNFGFRRFKNITPISSNEQITTMPVFYGELDEIPVYAEKDLTVTLPLGIEPIENEIHLVAKLNKNGEQNPILFAPIKKSYIVGEITAFHKDKEIGKVKLITKNNVSESGFFKKLKDWFSLKLNQ